MSIDEAGIGGFEMRNEVDDEVPRLARRILARLVGVMSSTKTRGSGSPLPVSLSLDGGER